MSNSCLIPPALWVPPPYSDSLALKYNSPFYGPSRNRSISITPIPTCISVTLTHEVNPSSQEVSLKRDTKQCGRPGIWWHPYTEVSFCLSCTSPYPTANTNTWFYTSWITLDYDYTLWSLYRQGLVPKEFLKPSPVSPINNVYTFLRTP